jgi:hypothetical protein
MEIGHGHLGNLDLHPLIRRDGGGDVEFHPHHLLDLMKSQFDHGVGERLVERQQWTELERKALFELTLLGLKAWPDVARGNDPFDVGPGSHRRNHNRLAIPHELLGGVVFTVVAAMSEVRQQDGGIFFRHDPALHTW